jgi:secondary thiamine-phosphate synthase enzyme
MSRVECGHASRTISVETKGQGFYRLGSAIERALEEMGAKTGLLSVFITHTSASLCIQENADPDVLLDLVDALRRLAPEGAHYRHNSEGPDDMPGHIKALLTASSLSVPVRNGSLALGTWQEIYLAEHRKTPHRRRLELDFIGGFAS